MACSERWRAAHPAKLHVSIPEALPAPTGPLVLLEIPLPVPPEDTPLTPEELARLAVFVLCGQIIDVTKAIAAVQATPWPVDEEVP